MVAALAVGLALGGGRADAGVQARASLQAVVPAHADKKPKPRKKPKPAKQRPAPTPSPPAGPTTVTKAGTTYTFGPEVPQATQAEVENALEAAKAFVQNTMGLATADFKLFGYGAVDEFLSSYAQEFNRPATSLGNLSSTLAQIQRVRGGYAETNVGLIFLWTASTPADRPLALTTAHEYFHVIQLQLSPQSGGQPPNQVRTNGPEWLAEGSAEWEGTKVAGNFGNALAAALTRVKSEKPDLSQLATPSGFRTIPNPFPVCMAAVDLLLQKPGPASLVAFWRAIGQGTPWQAAFQQAFGLTVDAFYAEFAAADE